MAISHRSRLPLFALWISMGLGASACGSTPLHGAPDAAGLSPSDSPGNHAPSDGGPSAAPSIDGAAPESDGGAVHVRAGDGGATAPGDGGDAAPENPRGDDGGAASQPTLRDGGASPSEPSPSDGGPSEPGPTDGGASIDPSPADGGAASSEPSDGGASIDPSPADGGAASSEPSDGGASTIPARGLRVEVSWSPTGADLDAHLLGSIGTADPFGPMGFFGLFSDCSPSFPEATFLDGTTALHQGDVRRGPGPEAIVVPAPAEGLYTVGVHYACDYGAGPTEATVRVYCDGALAVTTTARFPRAGLLWRALIVEWPGCRFELHQDAQSFDTSCDP